MNTHKLILPLLALITFGLTACDDESTTVSSVVNTVAATVTNEPEQNFRGHAWGSAPTATMEATKTYRPTPFEKNLSWYFEPNEKMKIGENNLHTVRYGFWNNKLAEVKIDIDSKETAAPIVGAYTSKYGKPDRIQLSDYGLQWNIRDMKIIVDYGFLILTSKRIVKQYNDAKNNAINSANQNATNDL